MRVLFSASRERRVRVANLAMTQQTAPQRPGAPYRRTIPNLYHLLVIARRPHLKQTRKSTYGQRCQSLNQRSGLVMLSSSTPS